MGNKKTLLSNFKHLRASGGINSKIASDYSILSTPFMILVDSNNTIIDIPESLKELDYLLNN